MCLVKVKKIILEDDLFFDRQNLLHYKIEYPQFFSYKYQNKLNVINNIYKRRALVLQRKVVDEYFQTAISYYLFSIKRDIPIRLFEVSYIPKITYNDNCTISLYYDEYVYMGGAHGVTFRTSDTWDIQDASYIRLEDIVRFEYREFDYIRHLIIDRVKQLVGSDDFIYFEGFEENISCQFYHENFYLVPEGVKIYYQQYDIAPYAAGIPEFLIPFDDAAIIEPKCNNNLLCNMHE